MPLCVSCMTVSTASGLVTALSLAIVGAFKRNSSIRKLGGCPSFRLVGHASLSWGSLGSMGARSMSVVLSLDAETFEFVSEETQAVETSSLSLEGCSSSSLASGSSGTMKALAVAVVVSTEAETVGFIS